MIGKTGTRTQQQPGSLTVGSAGITGTPRALGDVQMRVASLDMTGAFVDGNFNFGRSAPRSRAG